MQAPIEILISLCGDNLAYLYIQSYKYIQKMSQFIQIQPKFIAFVQLWKIQPNIQIPSLRLRLDKKETKKSMSLLKN